MSLPRFYVQNLAGTSARLSTRESDHAARARRLCVGDEIAVFDGAGREAVGRITATARAAVNVALGPITERPRPSPSLTLAVALPKGPRQDTLIEKCTELGAAAIIPLITARSVSRASDHKLDRWRQLSIQAAKQSGQAWLPAFHSPEPLAQALARIQTHDLALVAAPAMTDPIFAPGTRFTTVIAFVGPEGGWTPDELDQLTTAGCRRVSLGPNILRVETAAIALAAIVHLAQRTAQPRSLNPEP